jgi:hypothetical protein
VVRRLLSLPFLALVLVAGCGGDEFSPEAAVADAATKTTDAGSYRAEFSIAMEGLTPEPVTMTGEGLFDAKKQLGRMTFDMSELGKAAGGPDLGEAEMIFERFVVYMRFPFLQRLQPNLKPWIRFDLEKLGEQQGVDLAGLQQLNQSDPSQALAYLKAASGGVEKVGEEEVRGVETTHYRMTVDLRKVAKQIPEQKANVERVIETSGIEKIPTEVWVDGDGLVRRMKLHYENMQLAAGQKGDMTMTMELFDFGVPVDVELPPAGQVMDLSELAKTAS